MARALVTCAVLLGCAATPPAVVRDGGVDAPEVAVVDAGVVARVDASAGTVRFAEPVCFPALAHVERAVAGDLDRDGRLDLVLEYGGAGASGFGYARNTSSAGAVGFDARVDRLSSDAVPLLASRVTQAADLDGDGFPELLRDDRWWRNAQGASGPLTEATFAGAGQVYGGGIGFTTPDPRTLTVADLDRDGLRDLVSTQSGGACNMVAYPQRAGGPTPTFGMQQIFRVYVRGLTSCTSLALGDLDGDARLDVVVTSGNPDRGSGEQGFAVLRNGSSPGQLMEGVFGEALRWTTAESGERRVTRGARLADFNGDGRLDLLYTVTPPDGPGTRGVLRLHTGAAALGADTFGPAVELPGLGDEPAVVDLDGNGVPDLVSASGDQVTTVQNLAARGAAPTAAGFAVRSFTLAVGSRGATLAEVDGDGRADVVYVRDGGFCVMRNTTP